MAEPSCPTPAQSATENSHIVDLTDAPRSVEVVESGARNRDLSPVEDCCGLPSKGLIHTKAAALSDGKGYPARSETSFDHSSGYTTVNVFGNEELLLQDTSSLPSSSPSEAFGGNLFQREGDFGDENAAGWTVSDDAGYFSDSDAESTSIAGDDNFNFVEENARSYHADGMFPNA